MRPFVKPVRQAGYTLLEIMLVLVIAAAITLATVMAYNSYDGRQKAQVAADAVGQMSSNLRTVFQTGSGCSSAADTESAGNAASTFAYCGNYAGVGNLQDYMVKAGVFPPALLNSDKTTTRSPWGGTIGAATISLNGNADSGMSLTFYGVPASVCAPLVTRIDPVASRLEVGGTVVSDRTITTPKVLDISAMSTLCASGTTVVLTLDSPSAYLGTGTNPGTTLGSGTSGTIPASASSSIFVGPGTANNLTSFVPSGYVIPAGTTSSAVPPTSTNTVGAYTQPTYAPPVAR
jgi:prepilin-type N-terminal cleavage/methylation domain-containing protein